MDFGSLNIMKNISEVLISGSIFQAVIIINLSSMIVTKDVFYWKKNSYYLSVIVFQPFKNQKLKYKLI